jgi:hypothetical protein
MKIPGTISRRLAPFALLIFALAVTFFVYRPGLQGAFMFDDGPNILRNAYIAISSLTLDALRQAAFSSTSGPLNRPISMMSFAVNHYFSGFDPFYFKITNIGIHLLNGIGLFVLTILLLRAYRTRFQPELTDRHVHWVSLAVAAAWLLHPFNLTSVLYVVQRMTSLSALFSIWGLVLYAWGRMRFLEGRNGIWPVLTSLFLFTPFAMLCKETGALMPLLMFVVEISLFNFETKRAFARRFLMVVFIVTVALPAAAFLAYVATDPSRVIGGYFSRPFTLAERLMTEARVIWFYIQMIIVPTNGKMGLFHDDIVNSQGLLQPFTTLVSIVGLAALLGVSLLLRKKAPLVTFGVLFFLAGHLLESTIFALEIAHEHRNYLPMYGLILVLFFYLLYPLRFKDNLRLRQGIAILLIGLFSFNTYARSDKWSNPFDFAESELAHHPNSPRNNGEIAAIYANIATADRNAMETNYHLARYHYEKAVGLSPHYTNGLFGLIMLSASREKAIERKWIDMLEHRLANASYAHDNGDRLMALVACQTNGICKLAKDDIEAILHAPFRNPSLPGTSRALALSALSYYQVNVLRDYSTAIDTMRQAIETAPHELEYRMTLLKFLAALQRNQEAKIELAALKELDRMSAYSKQIESYDQLLNERTR